MGCSVCLIDYLQEHMKITLLKCGHTLCVQCVSKVSKCPLCQKQFQIDETRPIFLNNRPTFDKILDELGFIKIEPSEIKKMFENWCVIMLK